MAKTTKKKNGAKARLNQGEKVSAPLESSQIEGESTKKSDGQGMRIRVAALVIIVVGTFVYRHFSLPQNGGAPTAAAKMAVPIPAEWGNVIKLEKVSDFSVPSDISDFIVLEKGDTYLLGGTKMFYYAAGKLSRTADIPPSPNRSFTSDGKSLFVTNSEVNEIVAFDMAFGSPRSIAVKDANRLLGIAWSSKRGALIVANAGNNLFFEVAPSGKLLAKHRGPVQADPWGWVSDIAVDPQGKFVLVDNASGSLDFYSAQGKLERRLDKIGMSSQVNIRVAFSNGNLYVPFNLQGAVLIIDSKLAFKGHAPIKGARIARIGRDGFLYILADDEITKYKPL